MPAWPDIQALTTKIDVHKKVISREIEDKYVRPARGGCGDAACPSPPLEIHAAARLK
jgi:hypothetical protein